MGDLNNNPLAGPFDTALDFVAGMYYYYYIYVCHYPNLN